MTKEDVVKILTNNGYRCEIRENVPTVYVSDFEEETIYSVKRLIPDYHNSLGFRKIQLELDQEKTDENKQRTHR